MKLKCRINGKNYNIIQGASFSDEWNETLDSGTIMFSSIEKIEELLPYDDVYIWNADQDFMGYKFDESEESGVAHYDSKGNKVKLKFYKHLLLDNFSEELINIDDEKYKYKNSLFSETKRLETIVLPNTSITQPIKVEKRKNIYEHIQMFVDMYNPKIRRLLGDDSWIFEGRYKLHPRLKELFKDVYTPEFSLNNPTLRELLTQLMNVKDCIPVVRDDVIDAIDIANIQENFDYNKGEIKHVSGSMSSGDFCDSLRKNYNDALSADNTCRLVEKIGFRNTSGSFNMTLGNMQLETSFPIYKINKLLICYYKKAYIISKNGEKTECLYLCKQDITPLILPENIRSMLSQDWTQINVEGGKVLSIDEMAKYKYCTLGYTMGSNFITGWGEKYQYLKNFFSEPSVSYIQNILNNIDANNPLGIEDYNDIINKELVYAQNNLDGSLNIYTKLDLSNNSDFLQVIFPNDKPLLENLENPFDDNNNTDLGNVLKYKQLLFIADYEGFYNGVISYTKDDLQRENITKVDNSSSSLTLLEKDGVATKEKVKRFSNKGITIVARYNDINDLQNVGTIYDNPRYERNIIIYHREYSIYDNYIIANFNGTKNFVLRNYFTSVFSKYRLYNLMSYSESVRRAENRRIYLYLSTDNKYLEANVPVSDGLLDKHIDIFAENKNIDTTKATAVISEKNNQVHYLCDVNKFSAGNSLCFNFKMFDNISMGNYISNPSPDFDFDLFNYKDYDQVTGSMQTLLMLENDEGFIDKLRFKIYLSDITKDSSISGVNDLNDSMIVFGTNGFASDMYVKERYWGNFFKYPLLDKDIYEDIDIAFDVDNIDNKEYVDMTFEIETITDDKNIYFSNWVSKLSNVLSNYYKSNDTYQIYDTTKYNDDFEFININFGENQVPQGISYNNLDIWRKYGYSQVIVFRIKKDKLNKISKEQKCDMTYRFAAFPPRIVGDNIVNGLLINFNKINEINEDEASFDTSFILYSDDKVGYKDEQGRTLKFTRLKKEKNIVNTYKSYALYPNPPFVKQYGDKYYWYIVGEYDERISEYKGEEYGRCENPFLALNENGELYWEMRYSGTFLDGFDDEELDDGYYYYMFGLGAATCGDIKISSLNLNDVAYERDERVDYSVGNENVYELRNVYYPLSTTANGMAFRAISWLELLDVDWSDPNAFFNVNDYISTFDVFDKKQWEDKILKNTDIPLQDDTYTRSYIETALFSVPYPKLSYMESYNNRGNMIVIFDKEPMTTTIQYKTVQEDNFENYLGDTKVVQDMNVADVFEYDAETNSIRVGLTKIDSGYKSVQYWYFDAKSSSFVFVIGVNITDEMRSKGQVNIYSSVITSKDRRVFDEYNNVIGKVKNIAGSENVEDYNYQKIEKQ